VAYAPVEGRFKVYIIDEVHMLTREAFNALLKTLEEPPASVIFVLATTEPHKIPETIVSRCQRFDFRRPQVHDIARLLARIVESENQRSDEERGGPPVEIQEAALIEIARHSQGGFRDAIGTLEKLIAYGDGTIHPADVLEALGVTGTDLLFEVTDICLERRTAEALQFVQRLANEGVDFPQFIRDLLRHLRQVFLLQHLEESSDDEAALRALGQTVELDEELVRRLLPQANQLHPRELVTMIETLGQAQRDIKDGLDARLQLELALVKITRPQVDASVAGVEERLRRLETGLGATRFACETAGAKAETAAKTVAAATGRAADTPGPEATPGDGTPGDAEVEPVPRPVGDDVAEPSAGPASATAPELTLDRVRRAWELVLQRVQSGNVALYALLRDARPSALAGDRLTVAMPSDFALARVREPGNDDILASAFAETLGHRLQPEFVLAEPVAPATAEPEPRAQPPLDFTQTINLTKQLLDAEELDEP
jgi:DNA polymerase-3 subunit gamma/tau